MAATRFMLDTNIASHIIRGPSAPLAARLVAVPMAQLCVSAITQAELQYGLARKPEATNLHTAVREFFLRLQVLAWGDAAGYPLRRAAR